MDSVFVILPHNSPGTFRRVLRGANGEPILDNGGAEQVLLFPPGVPVELTAEQAEFVRPEIGPILKLAKVTDGAVAPKADAKATEEFISQSARATNRNRKWSKKDSDAKAE